MSAYGAESVTLALYRYRPSSIRGLILAVKADALDESKRAYLMYGIRTVIAYQSSGKSRFPTYAEYVKGLLDHDTADKRNASSIKNAILEKLKVVSA